MTGNAAARARRVDEARQATRCAVRQCAAAGKRRRAALTTAFLALSTGLVFAQHTPPDRDALFGQATPAAAVDDRSPPGSADTSRPAIDPSSISAMHAVVADPAATFNPNGHFGQGRAAGSPIIRDSAPAAAPGAGLRLVAPHQVIASADVDEPGRSLIPLVQPLYSELTPSQQTVLAPFETQWNSWSLAEKRSWVELADRFPAMPTAKKARIEKRIKEWAALSPERRKLVRDNYRLAQQLPPDQRVQQWEQYNALTADQKGVLRSAGTTSNTAAGHAGAPTGLAKEAAKPLSAAARAAAAAAGPPLVPTSNR